MASLSPHRGAMAQAPVLTLAGSSLTNEGDCSVTDESWHIGGHFLEFFGLRLFQYLKTKRTIE